MKNHGTSYRAERVASLIQRELETVLETEVIDWVGGTITEVKLTPNLKQATVYVDCDCDESHLEKYNTGASSCASFIRARLALRLTEMRGVPRLIFKKDNSREYYEHIETVIKGLHDEQSNK